MNWRTILAIVLVLAGAYTSISFLVDSSEGRLCWELGGGAYTRLPYLTAFRNAVGALAARSSHSVISALFELFILTAFIWPIAVFLSTDRPILIVNAVLLTLLPFGLFVYEQAAFGIEQYCNADGMADIGFMVIQLLLVPITVLVLLAARLTERIVVRFAAYNATRRAGRTGGRWL